MRSTVLRIGLAAMLTSLLLPAVTWAKAQKWADTGTVSAVTLESRIIVVEIPRGDDSLTVGATVLPGAVLKKDGRPIDLADIRVGDEVRIEWSRREHGDVAHEVIVLGQ